MSVVLKVIPTSQIRANKANVRDELGDLTELAASLRANGIQQPIIVTDQIDHFELIDGHRRHAAAAKAGIAHMPALVTDIQGTRPTVVTMLAAAMHKQLTPLEQAKAFQTLMDDGMPIRDIIAATGYTRPTINARLSLLDLPDECQDMVADGTLKLGEAVTLAKQVKATKSGSAVRSGEKSSWLQSTHRLARVVKQACTHHETRTVIGNTGCGQCWEQAIRDDVLAAEQAEPFDEAAVVRAVAGGYRHTEPMARADRLEAIRRLVELGHDDTTLAARTGVTARQALRDRQALGLASPSTQYAHPTERTAS